MSTGRRRWLMSILIGALLAVSVSCGPRAATLSETDQAQIYASVIGQLRHDHGGPAAGYIMGYTDDSGGTDTGMPGSKMLPESLKKAVLDALADTSGSYTWLSSFSDFPRQEGPAAACQIILGNIHHQDDGTVQVTASLFFGGTAGGGGTFVLKRESGVWTVTGTTGPIWIS